MLNGPYCFSYLRHPQALPFVYGICKPLYISSSRWRVHVRRDCWCVGVCGKLKYTSWCHDVLGSRIIIFCMTRVLDEPILWVGFRCEKVYQVSPSVFLLSARQYHPSDAECISLFCRALDKGLTSCECRIHSSVDICEQKHDQQPDWPAQKWVLNE